MVTIITLFFELSTAPIQTFHSLMGVSNHDTNSIIIFKIITFPFLLILSVLLIPGLVGIMIAILAAPISGFSKRTLDISQTMRVNQGIQHSLRSAVLTGFFCLINVAAAISLIVLVGDPQPLTLNKVIESIRLGMSIGLAIGFVVGLFNGGADCIKHMIFACCSGFLRVSPGTTPIF